MQTNWGEDFGPREHRVRWGSWRGEGGSAFDAAFTQLLWPHLTCRLLKQMYKYLLMNYF